MFIKLIKSMTPERWHSFMGLWKARIQLPLYYWRDFRHLFDSRASEYILCRSKLIKYYHRLEKALSTPRFEKGRGFRAADDLINSIDAYTAKNFDLSDPQFKVAVSVLQKFLQLQDYKADRLRERYEKIALEFELPKDMGITSGAVSLERSYFIEAAGASFDLLSARRHSVRDFESIPLDISLVNKAVYLAQKTPSVCNRQGWHLFVVQDLGVISLFKDIHKGFARDDQYLSTLLVVCFTKNAFDYPVERNQGYIDGGLFSMSLMYAFNHLGVACCPLNANITADSEKRLKKAMNMPNEYGLVMFLAVGHYKGNTTVPVSTRDAPAKKITFI